VKITHLRHAAVAATCLILVAATSACADDGGSKSDSPRVGVILSSSGPAAALGEDIEAALAAFKEIDPTTADLDIEYVTCDDKSTPEGASACARKFSQQDPVDMIFGPVIGAIHAKAAPILRTGPPSITPSPYVVPSADSPIFSVYGSAADMNHTIVKLAADRGYKRMALLATTDQTGTIAAENIQKSAGKLGVKVDVERFAAEDVDATAQLNRLLDTDPEYVYVAASGAAAGVALKGMKQLDADLPTALAGSNTSADFFAAASKALPSETLFAVTPSWMPDDLDDAERADQVRKFQRAFEKASDAPPSFVVQSVYDSFQVIAQALDKAGTDRDDIVDYMESLDESQGLNWKISFSKSRHNVSTFGNWTMARYDPAAKQWSLAD
jgi:branched-chain amino acid transport system substrate-binding protein